MPYAQDVDQITSLLKQHPTWNAINLKHAARMRAQNKFKTGLDIAKYTAKIMREDMANYDNDTAQYTQSWAAGTASLVSRRCCPLRNTSVPPSVVTCTCLAGW